MVSEEWKGLSSDEKKKYEDMAAKDKLRYAEEMKNYTPPPGMGKDGKAKADKGRPYKIRWPASSASRLEQYLNFVPSYLPMHRRRQEERPQCAKEAHDKLHAVLECQSGSGEGR